MTLFLRNNLYFRTKNSSMTPFLVSSYFATHPVTLLQILGGPMHGPFPTTTFGGNCAPVPPKSPPVHTSPPIFWKNVIRTLHYGCLQVVLSLHFRQSTFQMLK